MPVEILTTQGADPQRNAVGAELHSEILENPIDRKNIPEQEAQAAQELRRAIEEGPAIDPLTCEIWVPIAGPSRNGCVGYVVIQKMAGGGWRTVGFAVRAPGRVPVWCAGAGLESKMDEIDADIDNQRQYEAPGITH